VAPFAGITITGQWLSARVCPHCGHPPEDFVDEETLVEQVKVTKWLNINRFRYPW
jgi:hypothetical protein